MKTGTIKKLAAVTLASMFLVSTGAFAAQKCPKGEYWNKKSSECVARHQKKKMKMKAKKSEAATPATPATPASK